MNLRQSTEEYMDVLVSMELAASLARKFNEPISKAIRSCAAACMLRVKDERNYRILVGLRKQAFPYGALAMLRRKLEECLIAPAEGVKVEVRALMRATPGNSAQAITKTGELFWYDDDAEMWKQSTLSGKAAHARWWAIIEKYPDRRVQYGKITIEVPGYGK